MGKREGLMWADKGWEYGVGWGKWGRVGKRRRIKDGIMRKG